MSAERTRYTRGNQSQVANISENISKRRNKKSGQEMAKQESKARRSKTDLRYWQSRVFKNTFTRDGVREETANFCARIAHAGRRETFNLGTPNAAAAAEKAQKLYIKIKGAGWDAARAEFKPATAKPAKGSTVGELLRAVAELADVRPSTLRGYTATFRRIVADCEGVKTDPRRYARCGKGRDGWLAAVDSVPLVKITPSRVEEWKLRFVAKNGAGDEVKARSARNSVNSMLRMGKGLFAKRLLRFISERVVLPVPLPFDGVDLFPRQSMRYVSTINVEALLRAAREELFVQDIEAFKAFVLGLFGGLRRNEADKLRWDSVDFDAGLIRVEAQVDLAPKAETSLDDVPIDAEVGAILRGLRASEPEAVYVLAADAPKRKFKARRVEAREDAGATSNWAKYRADATFTRLATWLRAHGVKSRTPLHTLRKEAGSLIAEKEGIFAASRFLRHADVAITAQHYAAQKKRVTVGLGSMLTAGRENVIQFAHPVSPSVVPKVENAVVARGRRKAML